MNNVIYRQLSKEDYPRIKRLICEAFGFDEFIKDPYFLDLALNAYLQSCIVASSFSKVAVKDDTVIGIILGDAKNDKNKLRKAHNIFNIISTGAKLVFAKKENKKFFKEFLKIHNVYKEIISGKEDNFQGCIQLFIVSKESRGLGVGKTLVSTLSNYMKRMNVKSLYLYTDTRCNYGFYESQNFKRLNEKKVYFESLKESLNVFLYGYSL